MESWAQFTHFHSQNAFENIVCGMDILYRPKCVKWECVQRDAIDTSLAQQAQQTQVVILSSPHCSRLCNYNTLDWWNTIPGIKRSMSWSALRCHLYIIWNLVALKVWPWDRLYALKLTNCLIRRFQISKFRTYRWAKQIQQYVSTGILSDIWTCPLSLTYLPIQLKCRLDDSRKAIIWTEDDQFR